MNLFELLLIAELVAYVFIFGHKRDWSFILAACLMGPTVWYFELYRYMVEPKLKKAPEEWRQQRNGFALVCCLLLAGITVVTLKYFTHDIQLW